VLFDNADSMVHTEDVVSDTNITWAIVVGIWLAAIYLVRTMALVRLVVVSSLWW
jgi:uncharacterized membrane protein YccF (DUF307 family)